MQKELLKTFDSPKAVYDADEAALREAPRLNERAINSILASRSLEDVDRILEIASSKGIQLLQYDNVLYPPHARNCPESPVLLYYKGELLPFTHAVGVVGARRCTSYGRKVAREIGSELGKRKLTLVSGFAKGIDSYAQAACVHRGGNTIGVLANGVDMCYPKEQQSVYEQMIASGSVFISQYPPGTKPNFKYFLQRNALISAWSSEIIVVEAGESSGALWTAQFARRHGRAIYAVPQQLGVAEGEGTNRLIADKEASIYLGISSLKCMGNRGVNESREPKENTESISEGTICSKSDLSQCSNKPQILEYLSNTNSGKSIHEISAYFNQNEKQLLDELYTLELEGKIIIRGEIIATT